MQAIHRRHLSYLFASLLSLSISSPVWATTFTWQGPYVGGFLGEGFGSNRVSTNVGGVTDTSYFVTPADVNSVNSAGTWIQNPSTLLIGIQAGHDWVWKQLVYGVAFDYSKIPLSTSTTANNNYPDNSDQYSVYTSMRTNWLFTLRGRFGYQTMIHFPSLFYLTGGMAITQVKVNNNFFDNSAFAGTGGSSTSQNQIGWTAGAGIEVAVFSKATVYLEYLHVNVPSVKTVTSISNTQGGFGIPTQSLTNPLSTTANFHANVYKIGLNYRFDK